jgi:hypothetical protein
MDKNIKYKFKAIKNQMVINLGYLNYIIKDLDNIEDKRLTSNKLNKTSWLKRLY